RLVIGRETIHVPEQVPQQRRAAAKPSGDKDRTLAFIPGSRDADFRVRRRQGGIESFRTNVASIKDTLDGLHKDVPSLFARSEATKCAEQRISQRPAKPAEKA